HHTEILNALNTVQRTLNNELDLLELMVFDVTTVNLLSTTSMDLPSDFIKMIQVWDSLTPTRELVRFYPSNYIDYISDLTSTGDPLYYDILGSDGTLKQIYIYPGGPSVTGKISAFASLTGVPASFADYTTTVENTVLITDVAHGLVSGMNVIIAGTVNYNGTHEVTVVDADNFYISANYVAEAGGGTWTADGTVITDVDHNLATDDIITIAGTTNYDGTDQVIVIDDDNFFIDAVYVAELGAISKVWSKAKFIPFVYIKKLADLTSGGGANILTTFYPDLYIEGAAYIMYRDVIYRDQPEKIAFRKAEYQAQIEAVKKAQRQPDRIRKVSPKRVLPFTDRLYSVEGQT
ncbi:MAG: hypothetical protein ABIF11_00320, partial [Nitrospirota bacterium]